MTNRLTHSGLLLAAALVRATWLALDAMHIYWR